jgi:hypothetical protein
VNGDVTGGVGQGGCRNRLLGWWRKDVKKGEGVSSEWRETAGETG